jgi:ribosomal protein S18 acetylase RimI-like enzyme
VTDWSLRLAKPDDADAWPAIERAAAELFRGDPDLTEIDFDETWQAADLRRLIRKGHCLAAHLGERAIGFLASQPFGREPHIWAMSVHSDGQRRGIDDGLPASRRCAMIRFLD